MDDRFNYTKADWLMWTAALGNDDQVGVRNMVIIVLLLCVMLILTHCSLAQSLTWCTSLWMRLMVGIHSQTGT